MWESHANVRIRCYKYRCTTARWKILKAIDEEGYKYLGILGSDKIKENEMKLQLAKEYKL